MEYTKTTSEYLVQLGMTESRAVKIAAKYPFFMEILWEHPVQLKKLYISEAQAKRFRALDIRYRVAPEFYSLLSSFELDMYDILAVYEYLLGKDISEEAEVLGIVKTHPYVLHAAGVWFQKADTFAKKMYVKYKLSGKELLSDRVKASIVEVLRNCDNLMDNRLEDINGSTYVTWKQMEEYVNMLTGKDIEEGLLKDSIQYLWMNKYIHVTPSKYLMLEEISDIEYELGKRIHAKSESERKLSTFNNVDEILEKAQAELGILLSSEQEDAVRMALASPISVITGGPGTGKTAVQKVLIEAYKWGTRNKEVRLIAPTGQAAKRMTESTGYPASTIHKALGITTGDPLRNTWMDEVIDEELIIADEASMIDEKLFLRLLRSVKQESRLIVVGDVNQLPAIGIGCCLSELIRAESVPVTRLTKVFRQADDSPIAYNAARIKSGENEFIMNDNFRFHELSAADNFGKSLADVICDEYVEAVQRDGIDNVICLTAFRQFTDTGVDALNVRLRKLVRPELTDDTPHTEYNGKIFYAGDKVVYLQNKEPLVNGDVGKILKVLKTKITCQFGDEIVELKPKEIKHLDLAYAQTVHKSQGGEYKTVIMVADRKHKRMLTKELVYTAVTRAKENLICCTNEAQVFYDACQNPSIKRQSILSAIIDTKN